MRKLLALLMASALLMTACLPALASSSSWVRQSQTIASWDEEADIVIVGFGLSGAAAAIEAFEIDPETKLAIFEKAPVEGAGGGSIASGQCVLFVDENDLGTFRTYMRNLNDPQVLPEEWFNWLTHEMATDLPWIQAVLESANYEVGYSGGGALRWGSLVIEFEDIEGSNFIGATGHFRSKDLGKAFENGGCWNGFAKAVEARGIPVRYETPVVALVQDPLSTKVEGVIAKTADGKEIAVKANKGVVLCCGGYENNMQMLADFNGGDQYMSAGSPYNTGDGIKMLASVGAQLWHMDNHTMSCGYFNGIKVPDYETTFIRQFYPQNGSWIEVGADSTRFYNESKTYQRQHMKYKENGQYVDVPIYKSLPVDFIFDEDMRLAGPIVNDWIGWPVTNEAYPWSQDNAVELEKGWIIKADTVEELAEKLGRDPQTLKATIERYNEMCEKGVDEDFGRDIATMEKIDTAPYYAVALYPTLPATSGGAKRDPQGHVLNWDDEPIPGLYEAGELGSYVCNLYQNGTYLHEAIISGRAAVDTILGSRAQLTPKEAVARVAAPWEGKADGTYSKVVTGLHGDYEVIFTLKDGKLDAIEIGEGRENMFMTDEQLAQFAGAFVQTQSMEVDTVSGATIDSQAIVSALMTAFGMGDN